MKQKIHEYYFSPCYGCWMVISPYTGFNSPFSSEALALRFIRAELVKYEKSSAEDSWRNWQDLDKKERA